ncbi:MAG: hypothetical protein CBB69_007560 [Phycisphaera sp. TMED9]|nr:MAG: hypothetical protein CBB69_007560 [Phycisphaera sp. TMED9]
MKIAGGILLLIGGALGLIGDIMLLAIGSFATHIANSDNTQTHMSADTLRAMRQGIPDLHREAILLTICSLAFLVLGVIVLKSAQTWPGLVALVLAVLAFFFGAHLTAVLCLIGALLALFGSTSRASD